MPKITVIMPSLNVVKYIKPCIESVLCQTLSDIEILAVDAGSTDGTLEIWQEYEEKDSRIRLILSEKKSYGYQINLGISLAKGEYISIVETDDMIVEDMYESLYEAAKSSDADYVKGYAERFVDITANDSWRQPIARVGKKENIAGKRVSPCNKSQLLIEDNFLWLGIYRRDFLQNIRLNETPGAAFQDQGFLIQTISSAECAIYLDKLVYLYRQDNAGSSIYNQKGFEYLITEYALNQKYLNGKDQEWHVAFYQRLLSQCLGRFRNMAVFGVFQTEALADMETLRDRLQHAVNEELLDKDSLPLENWQKLQLYLQGAGYLYESYAQEYQKKENAINELMNVIGNRKVVIFGCGKWGKFLHALLVFRKRDSMAGYCDNLYNHRNALVQGEKVLKPEDAVEKYPDAVYVIASKYHTDEMKEQLCSLGIKERNILQYIAEIDVRLLIKRGMEDNHAL